MKVIRIPSSLGGMDKGKGTELAPAEVMKQTNELFFSEDGCMPVFEQEEIEVINGNIDETNENIYCKAKEVLHSTLRPMFLGGDHSITFPLVRAFSEVYPRNPGIIIFDAHPDAENDFMPPTQEDLLCALVNQDVIKKENILIVGIRNWDKNEIEFIRKNKIKYFPMKEIAREGLQEISESMMAVARGFDSLYVSIDVDVLDPAFAPGTGYIEPGGLTTRELLFMLHRLKNIRNLKAFDLVEINPKRDVNNLTTKLGAKILVELC